MKTPYTNDWIALDALGPEDEDAELRDHVSVSIDVGGASATLELMQAFDALRDPACAHFAAAGPLHHHWCGRGIASSAHHLEIDK
jgi:hypothetical protein